MLQCPVCHHQSSGVPAFVSHVKQAHEDQQEQTTQDFIRTNILNGILENVFSKVDLVMEGESSSFNCPKCSRTFPFRQGLVLHLKSHENNQAMHACTDCSMMFSTKQLRNLHQDAIHEKVRAIPCEFCSRSFDQLKGYKIHLAGSHKYQKKKRKRQEQEELRMKQTVVRLKKLKCDNLTRNYHEGEEIPEQSRRRSRRIMSKNESSDLTHNSEQALEEHGGKAIKLEQVQDEQNNIDLEIEQVFRTQSEHKCSNCGQVFEFSSMLRRHLVNHKVAEQSSTRHVQDKKSFILNNKPVLVKKPNTENRTTLANPKDETSLIKTTALTNPKAEQFLAKDMSNKQSFVSQAEKFPAPDYKCPHCPSTFQKTSLLIKHAKEHTENKKKAVVPFCYMCRLEFTSYRELEQHLQLHRSKILPKKELPAKDIIYVYRCSSCSVDFNSHDEIMKHKGQCGKKTIAGCHLCEETFASDQDRDNHVQLMHVARSTPPVCDVDTCKRAFASLQELKLHMERAHSSNNYKRNYMLKCVKCWKGFSSDREHEAHSRACSRGLQSLFQCNRCNESFGNEELLRQHTCNTHLITHKKGKLSLGAESGQKQNYNSRSLDIADDVKRELINID